MEIPRRIGTVDLPRIDQVGYVVRDLDATVALTHRDPVSVIQSAITMLAYGDRMRRTRVDLAGLAAYWIDRVERLLRACVRDRDRLPADRSVDVRFDVMMADDAAMVGEIYRRAGLEMTRAARGRLDDYMRENPRGRHGRLAYDLRRDFGLDPAEVRTRFGYYFDRFPVVVEDA